MRYLILILFNIVLYSTIHAQNIVGVPLIKNYTPKEINAGADNWAVAQDKRGVMYFGNSQGLIQYNGYTWDLFPNKNNTAIRSIAIANDNRIYVGGIGTIGYYKPNRNGELNFVSLLEKVPEANRNFIDVWKTYVTNDKVIFVTNQEVLIYQNNRIEVILPEGEFHFGFLIENEFYILDKGYGLKQLITNRLKLVSNGNFFANDKMYSLIQFDKDKLLVGTRRGLFTYQKSTSKIEKFNNDIINKFLIDNEIYDGVKLKNGSLSFATLLGGVLVLETDGNIKIIDEKSGIQDRSVHSIFEDKDQAIWICLEKGITKVNASSQISIFNKRYGLPEGIVNVVTTKKYIYCTTLRDIYAAEINVSSNANLSFNKIGTIPANCLQIKEFTVNGITHVLLATYAGIFEINNKEIVQINDWPTISVSQSMKNSNCFWVGTKFGILQLRFEKNVWNTIEIDSTFNEFEISNIIEHKIGKLVIISSDRGIYKADYDYEASKLKDVQSCDSNEVSITLYTYPFANSQKLYLSKIVGILELNNESNHFQTTTDFGKFSSRGQFKPCVFDNENNLFTSFNDSNGYKKIKFFKYGNSKYKEQISELSQFENLVINNFHFDIQNRLWIASADGLFLFNNKSSFKHQDYSTNIFQFSTKDSIFSNGLFLDENKISFIQPKQEIPVLKYSQNTVKFIFSASSYTNENDIQYSYYLEGLEDEFGNYSKSHECNYNKLREGIYTLHIKARNSYGIISKECSYTFTISPPWYRMWWAYLLYLVIFILLIFLTIQLSIRRLKKAKFILEETVKKRTREIVLEKENVEKQKKIIEEKNKDITDSINYAQRIQQAILPIDSDIKELMPHSFILFMPRDIVSGDFYWFSKISNHEFLFACVDCTGHGVPGAFMSMIGNTLLNEIVNQKKILQPSLILNELNLGVIQALKQNQENTQSRDGMDIALVKFNSNTRTLEFAGANRPLFILNSEKEILEIKADKFPIGGLQDTTMRVFTNQSLNLNANDKFYISTDGFADQFGGEHGKKFMVKKLKELIINSADLNMEKQKELFNNTIKSWMHNYEQVDDILLIGFKVE